MPHRLFRFGELLTDVIGLVEIAVGGLDGIRGQHREALGLLDDHLKHCVVDAAKAGGPEAEQKIKEASDAIARLVKS